MRSCVLAPTAMSTDQNSPFGIDAVDRDRLHTLVKLLLVAAGLVGLWWMVTNLPGLDALLTIRGVSLGAVLGALVTLAVVGVLVFVASATETVLRSVLGGPQDLVADVAAAGKHLLLFVAVLTAYDGLAPVAMPTLAPADLAWTYHLLFLALALVPLLTVVAALYGNVDAIAGWMVERATDDEDGEPIPVERSDGE